MRFGAFLTRNAPFRPLLSSFCAHRISLSPPHKGAISVKNPSLLSVDETARLARVHPRTMRRYLADNIGPDMTRIGGRVFIREDHFRAWLRRSVVPQTGTIHA
nr:helix-turn-helix domain-containing protein [Acetobacter estunensis]